MIILKGTKLDIREPGQSNKKKQNPNLKIPIENRNFFLVRKINGMYLSMGNSIQNSSAMVLALKDKQKTPVKDF